MARRHAGIFYASTHQWPLYPGTGLPEDDIAGAWTKLAQLEKTNRILQRDVEAIDQNVSADMRKQSPSLYKAVFLDRNAVWTKRIEQMLAGKGTIFIAVGAGHLVGKDSVIAELGRDGYNVTRE